MNTLNNIFFLSLKLSIVFISCFSNFQINAQTKRLDSLNNILKNAKHDTLKCNILWQLIENDEDNFTKYNEQLKKLAEAGFNSQVNSRLKKKFGKYLAQSHINEAYFYASNNQFKEALNCFTNTKNIQSQINDSAGIAESLINIGNCYRTLFENDKALKTFNKSLTIFKNLKNKNGTAEALYNIGYIYSNQENTPKALEVYHQSLKLFESINETEGIGKVISNIAIIYNKQGDTKTALEYYLKSLKLHTQNNDKQRVAVANNNIGKTYQKLQQYETALQYYTTSLKQFEEIKYKSGIGYTLNNIGDVYYFKKDYISALNYYKKSSAIRKEIEDLEGLTISYTNISETLYELNKLNDAKLKGLEGLKIGQKIDYPDAIKMASYNLYKIYTKQHNSADALDMYKLYITMRDSINNITTQKAAITKLAQYNYDKKALTDSLKVVEERKTADLKLQKEIATKRTLMISIVAVIIILIILSYLVFSLVKNIKERKKAYFTLQEKNIEIQYQSQKLLELSKEVTKYQTQMNPHFVFNALNSIQGFVVNNEKEKTLSQLQNFSKLMRQTLNNSATETITLKTELDFLKLYLAFENERFPKSINFTISNNLVEDETFIPPMLIQPLIENCLKHGGLNNVSNPNIHLSFVEAQDLMEIIVNDNGKGISKPIEEVYNSSHALGILKSRLKLIFNQAEIPEIENNITISSVLNNGTTIRFYLPLITKF